MRFALLFSVFLFLSTASFGQANSIEKEILAYKESQTELISKGRRLLLDSFEANDLAKVKSVKDYLVTEVQNDNYLALYPMEHWLLAYWTQDYKEILALVEQMDSTGYAQYVRQIKPQQDMLLDMVREKSYDSLPHLQNRLATADLRSIDKEFLQLHLTYILTKPDSLHNQREALNHQADEFLEGYPMSSYESFIREHIRHKYLPSKWGFGYELFGGYSSLTRGLNLHFSDMVNFGFGFDVYRKKWAISFRTYLGTGDVEKDIPVGQLWPKGTKASLTMPELAVGYVLAESRKFKLTPFVGIASTDIGPLQDDIDENPALEDAGLSFTTTYSAGAALDVKFGAYDHGRAREQNYWFLRFRYTYIQPQFDKHYPGFSGNFHTFTLGIGGFGRAINRDY